MLCKTEDATREVPAEEDPLRRGPEFAEQHGADVVTSSLGTSTVPTVGPDGHTTVTAIAVFVATASGVACCTARAAARPRSGRQPPHHAGRRRRRAHRGRGRAHAGVRVLHVRRAHRRRAHQARGAGHGHAGQERLALRRRADRRGRGHQRGDAGDRGSRGLPALRSPGVERLAARAHHQVGQLPGCRCPIASIYGWGIVDGARRWPRRHVDVHRRGWPARSACRS